MCIRDRFITDGMAEIIKYGCIKDSEFFEMLANGGIPQQTGAASDELKRKESPPF